MEPKTCTSISYWGEKNVSSKNFFRRLILDLLFFTNADVVTIKDETYRECPKNK